MTRVIDGDTVEAQPTSGLPTTVRLLGIDTPESVPTRGMRIQRRGRLPHRPPAERRVVLTTDPSQDRVDRFGRLLAYVDAGTIDVGLAMIRAGHAKVFVFQRRPFERLSIYEDAQSRPAAPNVAFGAMRRRLPQARPGAMSRAASRPSASSDATTSCSTSVDSRSPGRSSRRAFAAGSVRIRAGGRASGGQWAPG